ncbi:hypothetical protein HMPREF3191_01617 [Veillonellaceae bacterium DNF00626]|nr:hypothetical protein HMPREF3191_01617 [Veillonellaceae bacterium DNF00626]
MFLAKNIIVLSIYIFDEIHKLMHFAYKNRIFLICLILFNFSISE